MAAMLGGLLTVICTFTLVSSTQRGYVLQAPRVLNEKAINKLYLNLYDVNAAGKVSVKLLSRHNDSVYTEQTATIGEGASDPVIDFFVPDIDDYEARLQISGKFDTEDGYEIFGEDSVNFMTQHSKFIFIQTDKPLYKPGQEVKLRVLCVDGNLKPLSNIEGSVWIEDPDGSIVGQWKNVSFGNGLKQLEFPLSEEPKQGSWNIFASVNGEEEVAVFEVKEYVLPKFEVVITPPSYVLADAETIPIKICAKYTYGKLVEGSLKINASVESYSWSYDKLPVLQEEKELDGCYEYMLNVSLVDNDYQYYYRRIEIVAQVTEKGTGITRNETKHIDRTQSPLQLSFENEPTGFFKPGLPYHGVVKASNPDGSPAEGEPISICMVVSRERVISEWWATRKVKHCRNFTSDDKGLVHFTVPPQNTDAVNLNVEAKSLRYKNERASPRPTLYAPQTSIFLRPWHSPSGSHLQVQGGRNSLPCDTVKNIQILFTSKDSGEYRFYYEIISKGKVLAKNFVDTSFDIKDKISDDWADTVVTDEEIQIVPSAGNAGRPVNDDDNNCKAITESRYVPPIGSVNISLDVNASVSPYFHLLVYYVKDDREVVADSKRFSVEKCFQNKVSLEFGDESKQPGTKTSLSLSASPNSLCSVKVVDKSVTLLDSSGQLTKEKVFEQLNRYDFGRYYPRNHCNDKKQPGLEKQNSAQLRIPPHAPGWSSSSYEDALTAFENAGFLVISDLILLTRPCKGSGSGYEHTPMRTSGFGGGSSTFALASVASRRPAAPPAPMAVSAEAESKADVASTVTKSVVDVRTYFPETWLFDIERVDEDGKLVMKKTLPHTVTEWVGSAACINEEDGLGLSDLAHVKGFQAFFLSFTLPYSVIRGEKLPVIVSVFNYLDKCLPITVELEKSSGFNLLSDSEKTDVCVCGGKSETVRFYIQPTVLGTVNLTVSGKTSESPSVCGSSEVADSVARDAITNPLLVEAEGFPYEKVSSYLFCPKDYEDGRFKRSISYDLPEDVVEDSARGFLSASGDIMGPAIVGLDRLIQMPTGCGEQNIVLFAPNVYVMDYLASIGELTDKIKNQALKNLRTGYQRQLKYRRSDNSYSAFGNTDKKGSMFLTAFVLRTFSQAARYIDIEAKQLQEARNWILSKQQDDGCFRRVGRTYSQSLKGGIQDEDMSAPLTAYVLASLLISGLKDDNVTNLAMSCIEKESKLSPYKTALFAYTAALAGNKDKAEEYLKELYLKAESTGDQTFWYDKKGYASVQVEIASYAVLTNLLLEKPLQQSLPIIKWMNANRNSNGGFVTTQDTVLGLEAMSSFAPLLSKTPVDIKIDVSGNLEKSLTITNDDRLLVKRSKLTAVPGEVNVVAEGSGCAMVQSVIRCNTKTPHKKEYFNIELKSTRNSKEGCDHATINVCTRFLPESKKSNMALVEVKMVSGFAPMKESIEKLRGDTDVELKRYEVDNNNVVFYFDELTNKAKCFSFLVEQVVPVDDVKPATAKVYDYYATERQQETQYTIGECE